MSPAEQAVFTPVRIIRLETISGELVGTFNWYLPGFHPLSVGRDDRVYDFTFHMRGDAHVYREVRGEKRRLTEATIQIFDLDDPKD